MKAGKSSAQLPLTAAVYAIWSPDGQEIAVVRNQGKFEREITDKKGNKRTVGLDGKAIELWRVNWHNGFSAQKTASWSAGEDLILALAWSPDGKMLAAHSAFDGVRIWSRKGEELHRLNFRDTVMGGGGAPMPRSVAWSPNGQWIAATNGTNVELWKSPVTK